MNEPFVKSEINHHIANLQFFHPKGNSFPSSQLNRLVEEIERLGKNQQVKVIVLSSAGEKVFCAGASFDELRQLDNSTDAQQFFMGFGKVILAMRKCPKFIIGHIQGKVVGGGVGLVAACDYALANVVAQVKLSELSIGIGPFVIEPPIRRKIGVPAFSEMTLNPTEWKAAAWAKEVGLYNRVFDDSLALEQGVQEFAQQLSRYSTKAMQDLKTIMWEGTEDWNERLAERAALSGELVLSPETKKVLAGL